MTRRARISRAAALVAAALIGAGCGPQAPEEPRRAVSDQRRKAITASVAGLTREEVRKEMGRLTSILTPAEGTPRAEVDAAFGVPRVVQTQPVKMHQLKGGPVHAYELLEPGRGQYFRLRLRVTYSEGEVDESALAQWRVVNRVFAHEGTERAREQAKEIEREDRRVLADLIEACELHKGEIKPPLPGR